MSNPKFKVENYTNLGGINSKFSPHLTSPLEFLDIKNFDFQTPGSLTQRWGSTQYIGQTLAGKITALSEYQKLDGTSMIIFGSSGGLWHGATTGNHQGMSLTSLGATQLIGAGYSGDINGCVHAVQFHLTDLSSSFVYQSFAQGMFYKGSTQQYFWAYSTSFLVGSTFRWAEIVYPQNISSGYASIVYLVDKMFIANGSMFMKFDGTTCTPIGLPIPTAATLMTGYTTNPGASLVGFGGTGIAIFYVSYINNRGFESTIVPLASIMGSGNCTTMSRAYPLGLGAGYGTGLLYATLVINTPLTYGISAINVYSYVTQDKLNLFQYFPETDVWDYPFVKRFTYPVSGSTITAFPIGTTSGGQAIFKLNQGELANTNSNSYTNIGLTTGSSLPVAYMGTTLLDTLSNWLSYIYINGYMAYISDFYPQFLSVFDNRLFCAGFSSAPSTVVFSDVKEPEGYLPENSFEVRTNDSDYITAMKAYQTRLYIFKKNSFHVLSGDSPANFFVQEISNIYGCLNNRCVVIFENVMFFLDRKGVIEYTGANISFVSTKIQPIFDRMNYNSALTEACAAHDKLRNQVLFAIPIDGSTTNNITVVYDYVANAWTYHQGYNSSIFAEIQGRNTIRRLFNGDYSGRVNWFSASFLSDNGSAITLSYKTRYLHDLGDSVQKQFRRLYVNADQLSATLSNKINFYQDYGTSIVLSTTLNLGTFQERIDYGISAKSLAYELISVNTTSSPLKINGFTIESRMQRKV